MSIMELGALGEFVGAIGVILTLVYLAIQIRQNTRGIRASTVQAIQSAMNDAHSSVRNDLDSARVFRIGLAAQDLTVDELVQFRMLMYSVFAQFESIFFQKQQGTLDQEIFERHCQAMDFYLSTPGGRAWWRSCK